VGPSPKRWRAITSGEANDPTAYLWRAVFFAVRIPYSVGVRVRNTLFDWGWKKSHKVGVPVICVGNLTLGGTGKTPCVEWLARYLSEQGYSSTILSRGYGSVQGRNDEALVLEENLPDVPHLQGRDRVQIATTAIDELEPEVLILDDGFQHRRLQRDLDIVLLDGSDAWGRNRLFPHGFLREPRKGIRRAGIVIVTRANVLDSVRKTKLENEIRKLNSHCVIGFAEHRPMELLREGTDQKIELVKGKKVAAFCGLGNPLAFRKTLEDLGANVVAWKEYPDHHNYTKQDVTELVNWAHQSECELIVTTQKDWVKLRVDSLGEKPLYALRIGFHVIENLDEIEAKIMSVISPENNLTE